MSDGMVINPNFYEACFYGWSIEDCKRELIDFLNSYKKDIRYKIYDWYIPPVINLLNSSEAKTFDVISSKVKFQIEKISIEYSDNATLLTYDCDSFFISESYDEVKNKLEVVND